MGVIMLKPLFVHGYSTSSLSPLCDSMRLGGLPRPGLHEPAPATRSHRRRLEITAKIDSPGLRGEEFVDRRVGQAESHALPPLSPSASGNNGIEDLVDRGRIILDPEENARWARNRDRSCAAEIE